jgi:hypothetical protein
MLHDKTATEAGEEKPVRKRWFSWRRASTTAAAGLFVFVASKAWAAGMTLGPTFEVDLVWTLLEGLIAAFLIFTFFMVCRDARATEQRSIERESEATKKLGQEIELRNSREEGEKRKRSSEELDLAAALRIELDSTHGVLYGNREPPKLVFYVMIGNATSTPLAVVGFQFNYLSIAGVTVIPVTREGQVLVPEYQPLEAPLRIDARRSGGEIHPVTMERSALIGRTDWDGIFKFVLGSERVDIVLSGFLMIDIDGLSTRAFSFNQITCNVQFSR